VYLKRNDLGVVERVAREAVDDGADPANMRALEAALAVRTGRADDARRIVRELEGVPSLGSGALLMAAGTALRVGDLDAALSFFQRKLVWDLAPTLIRLDPELHPLLDHAPFAPRRWDVSLVWPLEAPMIDPARHALFREVRIESGLPKGSDLRLR
jgi:hypothetical protein